MTPPKNSIAPQLAEIKALVAGIEKDATKFDQGNHAAGTRVRRTMQQLKTAAQGIRETVLLK